MKASPLILAAAIGLASCQNKTQQPSSTLISMKDDVGHLVTLDHVPHRIISLAPSITETLFALALDSSVVGVTDYCDYPVPAKQKTRIGGILNPNIERILSLRPDLVLMSGSGNMRSDYDKLTASGVTVFVSYPRTLDGVF